MFIVQWGLRYPFDSTFRFQSRHHCRSSTHGHADEDDTYGASRGSVESCLGLTSCSSAACVTGKGVYVPSSGAP
jgi:hypothetical protein